MTFFALNSGFHKARQEQSNNDDLFSKGNLANEVGPNPLFFDFEATSLDFTPQGQHLFEFFGNPENYQQNNSSSSES